MFRVHVDWLPGMLWWKPRLGAYDDDDDDDDDDDGDDDEQDDNNNTMMILWQMANTSVLTVLI